MDKMSDIDAFFQWAEIGQFTSDQISSNMLKRGNDSWTLILS